MIMNSTHEPMRHPAGLLARSGKTGPRPSIGSRLNPLAPHPRPPALASPAGDLPKEDQGPRGACLPAKGASTLPAPGGQFGARSTLLCRIAKNEALSRNGARLNVGY